MYFTSHFRDIAVEFRIFIFYIYSTANPPIPRGHKALTSGVPKSAAGKGRGCGGCGCDGQGGGHNAGHGSGGDGGESETA